MRRWETLQPVIINLTSILVELKKNKLNKQLNNRREMNHYAWSQDVWNHSKKEHKRRE